MKGVEAIFSSKLSSRLSLSSDLEHSLTSILGAYALKE